MMAVALAMSCYHLLIAFIGPPNPIVLRSAHIGMALVLTFLIYPWRKAEREEDPSWLDLVLLAFAIACTAYPILNLQYFLTRMYYVDDPIFGDLVFGYGLILLILEGTRPMV